MSCYKPFLESVCLCLYGLIYLVKRLVKTIELRYVDALIGFLFLVTRSVKSIE